MPGSNVFLIDTKEGKIAILVTCQNNDSYAFWVAREIRLILNLFNSNVITIMNQYPV